MAHGLRIRHPDGAVILGIDDRLTRILGTITVGAPGSMNVPEAANGTPWVMTMDPNAAVGAFSQPMIPRWAGTTLIWEALQPPMPYRTTTLIYGLY